MSAGQKIPRRIAFGALVVFAAIQFVPTARTNPPVTDDIPAPPEAKAVIRRACYDCHSNETKWPWYSHIAPTSWLITHDVNEARAKMNFSEWNKMPAGERTRRLRQCLEEIKDKEMPPAIYLPMHPAARLSESDVTALRAWIKSVAPESGEDDK